MGSSDGALASKAAAVAYLPYQSAVKVSVCSPLTLPIFRFAL